MRQREDWRCKRGLQVSEWAWITLSLFLSTGIYAFVVLKAGVKESSDTPKELREVVRRVIGPLASPDKIMVSLLLGKILFGGGAGLLNATSGADTFTALGGA